MIANDKATAKALWRKSLLDEHRRQAALPGNLRKLDEKIRVHLEHFFIDKAGVWAGYMALKHEPRLQTPAQAGVLWVYPIVQEDSKNLLWCEPGPLGFHQGKLCREPVLEKAKLHDPQDLTGIIVPGVGFDTKGTRLGMGRGFYDRALPGIKTEWVVGIAYSFQVVGLGEATRTQDFLPQQDWDQRVRWLITDEGILQVQSSSE